MKKENKTEISKYQENKTRYYASILIFAGLGIILQVLLKVNLGAGVLYAALFLLILQYTNILHIDFKE